MSLKYLLVLKDTDLLLSSGFPLQLFSDFYNWVSLGVLCSATRRKCSFSFIRPKCAYFLPATHPLLHSLFSSFPIASENEVCGLEAL